MLSQIYNGKGWDVLRDGNIDKTELHELLKTHDRIVCLGHGTSNGLMNIQEVTIPNTVEIIGNDSFDNCESLRIVNIPPSVISKS